MMPISSYGGKQGLGQSSSAEVCGDRTLAVTELSRGKKKAARAGGGSAESGPRTECQIIAFNSVSSQASAFAKFIDSASARPQVARPLRSFKSAAGFRC